ncbi:MAG: glycine--tRNA ligase [DPANN group archaeon]|nr:glycine--tRNA ligase [DPANN group archaeon]
MKSIDELASFCKRAGFVFPSFEIYGGMAGFYDYGPRGVELKNNIKAQWWKSIVQDREDVVGIDAVTVNHPKVWEASGHVASFTDPLVDCKNCKSRFRADTLAKDILDADVAGSDLKTVTELLKKTNVRCPKCKGELTEARKYNLMFKTHVGPIESDENVAYLRPETAQLIYLNFKLVQDSARLKLPFGIAQIGRAYRNEIAPRDFLFRVREFEQMEMQYFIKPGAQSEQSSAAPRTKGASENKKFFEQWKKERMNWYLSLGIKKENLRFREHKKNELSHYAKAAADIEYNFPWGWGEIEGIHDRGDWDLSQHSKVSGKDLSYFDDEKKARFVPHVIEVSAGVDRAFLAFMCDAYKTEKERIVLKLNPKLAPIKAAVFPLVRNDKRIVKSAGNVFNELKKKFAVFYDASGNIGKSYRRQDEIGTPFCITVDFDSLKKKDVTVRDRDTMKQKRVKIKELTGYLEKQLR